MTTSDYSSKVTNAVCEQSGANYYTFGLDSHKSYSISGKSQGATMSSTDFKYLTFIRSLGVCQVFAT